jgi:hypothetical protein
VAKWYDEWDSGGDYFLEPTKDDAYEILWGNGAALDQHAQDLFVAAYFEGDENSRANAYLNLVDYMYEQYHIDFDETFEWTDFREWYDGVH